ncbi:MAG: hypothetical protein ABJG47_10840 [Ekhidna sp.]
MSLLMKSIPVSDTPVETPAVERPKVSGKNDEMTLVTQTINTQVSSMSEELKKIKRDATPPLQELFKETVENKGELDALKSRWTADDELMVEGLSQMTLHSFLLKAEELGKNITYTRTLKVEITD